MRNNNAILTTTRKGWIPLLTLALLAWTASQQDAAAAVVFFDDFTSDTSANYTQSGYQGAGNGSYIFNSPASELSGTGGGGNSSTKLMNNTASLDVGESLRLSVTSLDDLNDRAGLLLSDTATFEIFSLDNSYHMWVVSKGNGTAFVRLDRRNDMTTLFSNNTSPFTSPTTANPATLRIDRIGTDDYEFYVNNSLVFTDSNSFAANLIGIESYEFGGASGSRYGSVGISAIPEPSSLALLALGMVGLVRRRRN